MDPNANADLAQEVQDDIEAIEEGEMEDDGDAMDDGEEKAM